MIAVDAKIIVRFLVRDDEERAQKVYRRMKRAGGRFPSHVFIPRPLIS